jgi:hypothetical protein
MTCSRHVAPLPERTYLHIREKTASQIGSGAILKSQGQLKTNLIYGALRSTIAGDRESEWH